MRRKVKLTYVLEVKFNKYRIMFSSIGFEADGTGYLSIEEAPVKIDKGNQRFGSYMFTGLNYWNYFLGDIKKENSKVVLPDSYQYSSNLDNFNGYNCKYKELFYTALFEDVCFDKMEIIPQYMYVFAKGSVKKVCYELADKCNVQWINPQVCVTTKLENFATLMKACYGLECDFGLVLI